MLRDEVIYLRKLEVTDLDRTWEWINTPEIFITMVVNAPTTKTAQLRWFETLDKSSDKIVFAICTQQDDRHVGNISLDTIDQRHRNARLAIFLADQASRGKRIGTHAVSLLLEYAFDFLNLHRVYLKIDAEREQELVHFYGRFGFEIEGRMRQHEFRYGRYIDKLMLGVLRDEWVEA
jgi:RimJ/RimL family protein N-acetyltransferase